MHDSNGQAREGELLAQRLLTMRLGNRDPASIVDHAIENKDHLLEATIYLVALASRFIGSEEVWRETLVQIQEDKNGF